MWFFLACFGSEQKPVPIPKKQVMFAKDSDQEAFLEIVKEQDYEVKGEFQSGFFYALLDTPISADFAIDFRARSFRMLHVKTGIEAHGKRERSVQDIWDTYHPLFHDSPKHIVAYGGAPWFTGGMVERVALVKQLGQYFFGLEEREGVVPFPQASPLVFAGEVASATFLSDADLGLACTKMEGFSSVYWCEAPELDLDCVEKTQKWIDSLWSLGLTHSTEGKYRAAFHTQKVRLCLPSGCYDCNGIGCKNTASSEGMPVHIDQKTWRICVEKSFDSDTGRTRVCLNQQSYADKKAGIYIDDCRR